MQRLKTSTSLLNEASFEIGYVTQSGVSIIDVERGG
jgi:hypothetical protein